MRISTLALYFCFFLSGASALVYEIVWQRMLTLVFGLTTFSVAAVLSAFLAGLALGARLFGRVADRAENPTRLYAGIELGIALTGAASLYVIPPLMRVFVTLYQTVEPDWLGSNLIRFGLAFVAFCVPSTLIGATVPLMARLVNDRVGKLSVAFGRFYAVNTLGSLCGAALAGFVLLRILGVEATLSCAVVGNVAACLIAFACGSARRAVRGDFGAQADDFGPVLGPASPSQVRFALIVALVSGAAALAYEVAWIRLMAIYTLNSVYVFTMVVSVYLAALAIGAGVTARLLRVPRFDSNKALSVAQVGLAWTVPLLLGLLPFANRLDITKTNAAAGHIFFLEYALTAVVVLLPALLIGMTLPLLVAMFSASPTESGRTVGRIYAWNAVGTIAGAALTGAFLVPLWGLRGTLLLLAALNVAIAAAVTVMDARPSRRWSVVVPLGAAGFAFLLAVLPPTSRFYRLPEEADAKVLYYAEGPSATVHVMEFPDSGKPWRMLYVDSKSVAGTYEEIVTDQKMLAHLPLLLHPDPQRVLTVGFGTGGTSYSMLQHHVRVECVEIEPRVPEAYREFDSENHGLVGPHHNRTDFELILEDARAWLQVAPHPYDVIVTDVTSIQYRGNGNLYTVEYFQLMRDRLAPGGLACAWIPASGITPAQLKVLLRSFQAVYPHTSVWYMLNLPTDFYILVGSEARLRIPLDTMAQRMRRTLVQRDLAVIGMDNPYKLAACLLLADERLAEYTGTGPLHTDDHPILDYMTHATPYRDTLTENLREALAHRVDPTDYIVSWPAGGAAPEEWRRWRAAGTLLIEGHAILHDHLPDRAGRARAAYAAAAKLVPGDRVTRSLVEGLTRPWNRSATSHDRDAGR